MTGKLQFYRGTAVSSEAAPSLSLLENVLDPGPNPVDRAEWDLVYTLNARGGMFSSRAIFVFVKVDNLWFLKEWIDTTMETDEETGEFLQTSGSLRGVLFHDIAEKGPGGGPDTPDRRRQQPREVVQFILTESGHEVLTAADGAEGLELLAEEPDLVITDIRMPGMDGMEVLRRIRDTASNAGVPVIMLTAHGTVEQAVEAMRLGAFTYLLKPFAREELKLTVEQALHTRALAQDNIRLRRLLKNRAPECGLVYRSGCHGRGHGSVAPGRAQRRVGSSDRRKRNGQGTGGPGLSRSFRPLGPALRDGELRGHPRHPDGIRTVRPRQGRLHRSRAGGPGPDPIGRTAALFSWMKSPSFRWTCNRNCCGCWKPSRWIRWAVPVRWRWTSVWCAPPTATWPPKRQQGRFREDLLYRINVLQLTLPPLRERPEDVGPLWDHFTRLHGGVEIVSEKELLGTLKTRPWRGNVRELKNLNQRLVLMRQQDTLTLADLERLAPRAGDLAPLSSDPDSTDRRPASGPPARRRIVSGRPGKRGDPPRPGNLRRQPLQDRRLPGDSPACAGLPPHKIRTG